VVLWARDLHDHREKKAKARLKVVPGKRPWRPAVCDD